MMRGRNRMVERYIWVFLFHISSDSLVNWLERLQILPTMNIPQVWGPHVSYGAGPVLELSSRVP